MITPCKGNPKAVPQQGKIRDSGMLREEQRAHLEWAIFRIFTQKPLSPFSVGSLCSESRSCGEREEPGAGGEGKPVPTGEPGGCCPSCSRERARRSPTPLENPRTGLGRARERSERGFEEPKVAPGQGFWHKHSQGSSGGMGTEHPVLGQHSRSLERGKRGTRVSPGAAWSLGMALTATSAWGPPGEDERGAERSGSEPVADEHKRWLTNTNGG